MKTTSSSYVRPLFADQPIRALTIRYLAILSIPGELIYTWLAFTDGNYLSAAANFLGFSCAVLVLTTSLQNKLTQRLIYFACCYYSLMIVLVIFFDSANPTSIMWLIVAPPLAIFCMGTKPGAILCVVFLPFIIIALFLTDTIPLSLFAVEFRYFYVIAYLLIFFISLVSAWVGDEHLRGLLEAQSRIEKLEQILPMCMHCKKVKVEGEWDEVETYIMNESKVSVSHGLCDACQKIHYQDHLEGLQEK